MLYLARFQGDLLPLLVDVMGDAPVDLERALALIEEATEARPVTMHPCPEGIIYGEVRFASPNQGANDADGDGNPADHSAMGVVIEPFDDFAEWLEDVDCLPHPAPSLALAPTEPPAEAEEGTPDGG